MNTKSTNLLFALLVATGCNATHNTTVPSVNSSTQALSTQLTAQAAAEIATTLPSAPAGFIIGLNTTTSATTFTTAPAPAVVHVHALNLPAHPNDWLTEQYQWDFGDLSGQLVIDPRTSKSVDLNQSTPGPVAAYLYEKPGTYTITLHRSLTDGQTRTYVTHVIVPPANRKVYYISPTGNDANTGTDPAHAFRSATAIVNRVADHTEFRFLRGGTYTLNLELALKHRDVLIDCYGPTKDPLPIIYRSDPGSSSQTFSLVFSFWPGVSANVTIRHLRIDSPYKTALTAGNYAYHSPWASFGIVRGSNITVGDCEFVNLLEGPHGDPTLTGGLFLRNRQVDPLGIPSRTLWLEGTDIVAIGNIAINSVNESPLRAAATGVNRGLIAFNDIAQQLDTAHGRGSAQAAATLRTLADVLVSRNRVTNGELSFDPHSASALDQRIVGENNAIFGSFLHVKANVRHAIFRNNTIVRDQGPCITVTPGNAADEWIDDLLIIDNKATGWKPNGRMLQIDAHGANALSDFNFDAKSNVYTHIAAPATNPGKSPGVFTGG